MQGSHHRTLGVHFVLSCGAEFPGMHPFQYLEPEVGGITRRSVQKYQLWACEPGWTPCACCRNEVGKAAGRAVVGQEDVQSQR
jgi:hypothetical protein